MALIKIKFLIFFDRVPQLPAFNGSGYKINNENTIIDTNFTINNFDSQGPLDKVLGVLVATLVTLVKLVTLVTLVTAL
jgi:hypothetical protein